MRDRLRRSRFFLRQHSRCPRFHYMGLDFSRACDLFTGSEKELALALGMSVADVRELRTNPRRANADVVAKLSKVLVERGKAMQRVGEMLLDDG